MCIKAIYVLSSSFEEAPRSTCIVELGASLASTHIYHRPSTLASQQLNQPSVALRVFTITGLPVARHYYMKLVTVEWLVSTWLHDLP